MRKDKLQRILNSSGVKEKFIKDWKKVTAVLSCVVVLGTISVLSMPALTLSDAQCGQEEHQHTESCYAPSQLRTLTCQDTLELHTHTGDCYDSDGHLICGQADYVVHTHDSLCYDADGQLVCYLPEVKEHQHTESCYRLSEDITEDGHTHSDTCYAQERKLICDLEETELQATPEDGTESSGHQHMEDCYEVTLGELICGQEESEPVVIQGEPVLTCGRPEVKLHIHSDDCIGSCTKLQIKAHQHTEDCFTVIEGDPILVCDIVEHKHSDLCSDEVATESDEVNKDDFSDLSDRKKAPKLSASNTNNAESDLIEIESAWINTIDIKKSNDGATWYSYPNPDGQPFVIGLNDEILVKLNFEIPAYTLNENQRTVRYQLPEDAHLNISQNATGPVTSGGYTIGTYVISTDGYITIEYTEETAQSNADGLSISQSYVTFYAKVNQSDIGDDGTVDVHFTDSISVTIRTQEEHGREEDLQVEKEVLSTDPATGTVVFQIRVRSENGTAEPVLLDDWMYNLTLEDELTVENQSATRDNGNRHFALTLPQMQAGQEYTFSYAAKVPQAMLDSTNGNIYTSNKVTVTSTDEDGRPLRDEHEVKPTVEHNVLDKQVKTEDGKLRWTITVNAAGSNLQGWTLSDELNGLPYTGPVDISPAINGQTSIMLPYTFPEGAAQTYTITYITDAEKALHSTNAINKATLSPPDPTSPPITVQKEQWVGGPSFNPIKKTANYTDASNHEKSSDGTIVLDWTLTVDTADGTLTAPWVLEDDLENGIQWFTAAQMQAFINQFSDWNYTPQFTRLDNGVVSVLTEGERYKAVKLIFSTTVPKGTPPRTISYQTTADVSDGKDHEFFNNAILNDVPMDKPHITYNNFTSPTIKKYDAQNENGGSKTTHDLRTEKVQPTWIVELTIPAGYNLNDLSVLETLPQGLELKALSYTLNGGTDKVVIEQSESKVAAMATDAITYYKNSSDSRNIHIWLPSSIVNNNEENAVDKVFRILVETEIADNAVWTPVGHDNMAERISFVNDAQVLDTSGKKYDGSKQTQEFTRKKELPVINKFSGTVANNTVPYTLEINPDGKDLVPGTEVLTLVDELKYQPYNFEYLYNVNLDPDSVHIYYRNEDGSVGPELGSSEYSYRYEELQEYLNEWVPLNYTKKLTFTLPDSTPLIIRYDYKLSGVGQWTTINNTATLVGTSEGDQSDGKSTSINISESSAGGVLEGIVIHKVDSKDFGKSLSGAEFSLFKWNAQTQAYDIRITDPEVFVTGANGTVVLTNLEFNTAYRLIEVKAPFNYLLDSEPFDFVLQHNDKTTYPVSLPTDFNGSRYYTGDSIYRQNTEAPPGPPLPETGGIGTNYYRIAGLGLMIGCTAIYLYLRRRRKEAC